MARGGNKNDSGNNGSAIKGTGKDDILSDEGLAAVLIGGRGSDLYIVSNADTVVEESDGGGTDEIRTGLDFLLGSWVENLTLTGSANVSGTGNELDNVLLGNDGDNLLLGLGGNDTIDGGAGDDTLKGGSGDDLLIGGSGIDVALFDGAAAEYEIFRDGDEIWVRRGADSSVLRSVETLRFSDGDIAAEDVGGTTTGPVAVADSASGVEDNVLTVRVLENDLGQGIQVAVANNGAKGLVEVNTDGSITYRPYANVAGTDSFSYTITDVNGLTSSTTVSVTLAATNDAPNANDDAFSTLEGQVLTGAVLGNDTDVDNDPLSISSYQQSSAQGGTVSMSTDGSFTYSAVSGFSGADSFTYTVTDGNGGFDTATVNVTVEPAGDPDAPPYYVTGLIYGEDYRLNWGQPIGTGTVVTYAFLDSLPAYYSNRSFEDGFQSFTAQHEQVTRDALARIASLTGLTFIETSVDQAGMTFGLTQLGAGLGSAYAPMGSGVGTVYSDVWIDVDFAGDTFVIGSSAYKTLLHEIGHAVGLKHSSLPAGENNQKYTLMANLSHPDMSTPPEDYMLYDIAAMQYLYGDNSGHAAGNDVYNFATLAGDIESIWDGGGHDRLDMSAATYGVRLDLREGGFSSVTPSGSNNVVIAYGAVIEDATGSAYADVITGNQGENRITGGLGNDTMTGSGGADEFVFGPKWGADVITDFASGTDVLDFTGSGLSYGDLAISSEADGVHVSHGSDVLVLSGVGSVESGDFLFGSA